MAVLDWMLDSDPSIRWQTLRDLVDAPAEVVAAERARVATEGWGARLLTLQGEDGLWDGGALFPSPRDPSEQYGGLHGQPWTATAYSLLLLRDLGVEPGCDQVRRAAARGICTRSSPSSCRRRSPSRRKSSTKSCATPRASIRGAGSRDNRAQFVGNCAATVASRNPRRGTFLATSSFQGLCIPTWRWPCR